MHDHAQWDPSGADRVIAGEGTPEAAWRAWPDLQAFPAMTIDELVPAGSRAVIVAPHPDDEMLGTGGLIATLLERHLASGSQDAPPVLIVAVTDGTGSHPDSPLWPAEKLAAARTAETSAALTALATSVAHAAAATDTSETSDMRDISPVPVLRVGLPDGNVSAHEDALDAFLRRHCRAGDILFSTWRFDGHPDHEAVGRASARAASALPARLIELPVWTWHWAQPGDPRLPWQRARRLALSDAVTEAKRRAAQAYTSQLDADPSTGAAPILPPFVLARVLRAFELFFV